MKKKKNPNDAMFRNINALKTKNIEVIRHLHLVEKTLDAVVSITSDLTNRIEKLERKLHNAHIR